MNHRLLASIKPRTLRSEVLSILRDAIVWGQLAPGQHLKENEIADQLDVSRSPVREAFRHLEQEGLITSIPNQGSFVREFDEHDIRDIFRLRTTLEVLACELIVERGGLTDADLTYLEALIGQQKAASESADFEELTQLDMDFHEFLCEKAGSERLLKMWRSLRTQILVLFYQRFRAYPDYVPATVESDHRAILDALLAANLERISQLHADINVRVADESVRALHAARG